MTKVKIIFFYKYHNLVGNFDISDSIEESADLVDIKEENKET